VEPLLHHIKDAGVAGFYAKRLFEFGIAHRRNSGAGIRAHVDWDLVRGLMVNRGEYAFS
jgi:hypothetical protein